MPLALTNDNRVWLYGLLDTSNGSYVNNAVLTFTMYDASGSVVPGASGISMAYQAGTNGNYLGILPASVSLMATWNYKFVISASNYNFQHTFTEYAQVG